MPTNKIIQKLYNDEVEIEFMPDSHRYKIAGQRTYLTSVTAITGLIDKSRFLIPWAVNLTGAYLKEYLDKVTGMKLTSEELYPVIEEALKQHTIKKEEAASLGSMVHDFCEQFSKFKSGKSLVCPEITADMPEGVVKGINAFLEWFMGHDVKFLESERLVFSRTNEFVGMLDAIAMVDGKKMLIDYKTSKNVYNEHYYQVAGYKLAYEEEMGKNIEGCTILHFNKETGVFGDPIQRTQEDFEADAPVFLSLLTVKEREKELAKLSGWGS